MRKLLRTAPLVKKPRFEPGPFLATSGSAIRADVENPKPETRNPNTDTTRTSKRTWTQQKSTFSKTRNPKLGKERNAQFEPPKSKTVNQDKQKDFDKAEEYFQRAVDEAPDDPG